MADDVTDEQKVFFKRVDAHVSLANSHIADGEMMGPITGAMMFGTARFNAWMVAFGSENVEHLKTVKDETLELFTKQYSDMMAQHLDYYVENYDALQKQPK
ncbi:MAG: DUF3144 domain-containing protein [Alphaproteobacteria bacterium]